MKTGVPAFTTLLARTLPKAAILLPALLLAGLSAIASDVPPPGPNDVQIAPDYVDIPLGRILLIRKEKEVCAVKFLRFWNGETAEDRYASYEAYEPPKGSAAFTDPGMKIEKREASTTRPRGIGPLSFNFGNTEVRCGSFRLFWKGTGGVYFHRDGRQAGDSGIGLAPTYWDDIAKVDPNDFRIIWYQYDARRERSNHPIGDFALY
jgi:hypothetical protein